MKKFDIFSSCLCKKIATSPKVGLKYDAQGSTPPPKTEEQQPHKYESPKQISTTEENRKNHGNRDNNGHQGIFEHETNLQRSNSVPTKKAVKFDLGSPGDLLHYAAKGQVDFSWVEVAAQSESKALHELVRKKRVELRKASGKLKIDLENLRNMRERLELKKAAGSANLPDLVASDTNAPDSDFLREFRKLYDSAMAEINTRTTGLQELTQRYNSMLGDPSSHGIIIGNGLSEDRKASVDDESQKVVHDSERVLCMLKKAMKVATIEHNLKTSLVDKSSVNSQSIEDLESVLLELQRMKTSEGIEFQSSSQLEQLEVPTSHARDKEGATCASIRLLFGELFSSSYLLRIERDAKLKLAELHIEALDLRRKQNDAKFLLNQAIENRSEVDLNQAIIVARNAKMSAEDEVLSRAESMLSDIAQQGIFCRQHLKEATSLSSIEKINKALKESQSLKIPDEDPTVVEAKRKLSILQDKNEQIKRYTTDLKKAMKKKNANQIQDALVNIKSTRVSTDAKVIEEATNLLISLRKTNEEDQKNQVESIRLRLVEILRSDGEQDIADALVRAQSVGLSNSVELMGAKAKLVQLQKEKEGYENEIKKIEGYLDKLVVKSEDSTVTVDTIMTMERAVSVANCLDVCPLLKERANKALDSLNTKRDKVKSVKDELQRAVMECRHEAITCAIAEAESLPYFLTFDPLDGQISAILEYARNKIAPHNSPSDAGEGRSPVQRVKSNLKRAMRGNSYLKLESAINLYRTTYNIGEKGEFLESEKQLTPEEEENLLLIRRAERRCRRMKREERVAEREWKKTRNMLRENLRSAMKEKDRAELWKAVYQFKRKMGSSLDKEDETLLAEARKHLREVTILQVKTNLSNALVDRDSTRLKHSLGELDSPSLTMFPVTMDVNFRGEVTRAKKLLGHLKEMDRLRKSVAEMSRSQLAEIHRYPSPPACVRAVMIATYILLGEKEKELKDWTAVMRLLVKMGRESLTRRVAICVPIHIPAAAAHRAKEILSEWTIQQVQDISKVAAVFFAWSRCTVSEVFDRHESGDGERPIPSNKPPRQVDKQKEMPKDPVKSEFWNRLSRPRSSAPVTRPLRSFRINHMRPTSALK